MSHLATPTHLSNHASVSSSPTSSSQHTFSTLHRLGASTLTDDASREIGELDSMPFTIGGGGIGSQPITARSGYSSHHHEQHHNILPIPTADSSQPGAAFLKGREARIERDDTANRFQFAAFGAQAMGVSHNNQQQQQQAMTPISTLSSTLSSPSSQTNEKADDPFSSSRRELRANMERREEQLAAARIKGASLLSFAIPSVISASPATTVSAASTTTPTIATLKPYVRYTPKYNLPFGDLPRQNPPPPPPSQAVPTSNGTNDASTSSTDPTTGQPSLNSLAQVRSTTYFNMTGSITTHVGVNLNPDVFAAGVVNGEINAGVTTGRKSAGRQRIAQSTSLHQLQEEKQPINANENEEDAADGTFLTGVNISEQQRSAGTTSSTARDQRIQPRRDRTGSATSTQHVTLTETRILPSVTPEELLHFSSLTSVEQAVSSLPRFLRPTSEAITEAHRKAQALAAATATQPGYAQNRTPKPLPALPQLEIPPRVDVEELLEIALETVRFGGKSKEGQPGDDSSNNTPQYSPSSLTSHPLSSLRESTFRKYFLSQPSREVIKDTFWWCVLYFFGLDENENGKSEEGGKEQQEEKEQEKEKGSTTVTTTGKNSHRPNSTPSSNKQRSSSPTTAEPEMYLYRSYAFHLKKYAEQEGYLKKQREWQDECEAIRRQEKESHEKIGTGVGGGGGGGGGGNGSSNNNNQSSSHNPITSSHALPSHKEELLFPPAPILTIKQKRQPLVLLGDIPTFDVQARLNQGPIPVNSKDENKDSSFTPDYTSSSFLLSSLKSRISSQFVQLFLSIPSATQKDFFYQYYPDLVSQVIYYSLLIAYPSSRLLLNHSFFKLRLSQVLAQWICGYIPSRNVLDENLKKWKGEMGFITGELGVRKGVAKDTAQQQVIKSGEGEDGDTSDQKLLTSSSEKNDLSADGASDDDPDSDPSASTHASLDDAPAPSSITSSSSSGQSHTTSQYVTQLEKRLNAHLAATSKTARKAQQQQQQQQQAQVGTINTNAAAAAANTSGSTSVTLPSSKRKGNAGLDLLNAAASSASRTKNINGSNSNNNNNNTSVSTTADLTGDLLIDVGVSAARNPNRVPLRVTRKKVELHHSELIADFLKQRNFAHQTNHALKIPLSVPMNDSRGVGNHGGGSDGDFDRSLLLDYMLSNLTSVRAQSSSLRDEYELSTQSYNRLQSKQKRELSELERRVDQERERALRESTVFSKTLVAEYQDAKYAECKGMNNGSSNGGSSSSGGSNQQGGTSGISSQNPNSIALRRLGHFRTGGAKKDSSDHRHGGADSDGELATSHRSEYSSTLIKSALHM